LVLALCAGSLFASLSAQPQPSAANVNSLFVDRFSGGSESATLRDSLVRHLSKSGFHIAPARKDADAVIEGTGQVWVRGYITTNPRSPATNRQAVFAGYLSLEMVSPNGEPLWSCLVTPGKLVWNNIVDDLAGRAAKKLYDAAATMTRSSLSSDITPSTAQAALTGAGATFPAPLYKKWFEDFHQYHSQTQIQYAPTGSRLGIQKLVAGEIDFAGSDVWPERVASPETAAHLRRFATVLGAVVPIYNLGGITRDLRFTPTMLADIFLGRIKRWDDPEIVRWNKGLPLPDAEIVVVHRSDGSGTTWVWSDFLSKVSPAWSSKLGRGTTLDWPTGTGAAGNEGVTDLVKQTPNSLGYVEITYAIQNRLSFGSVRNSAGEFIRADSDSVAEAVNEIDVTSNIPESITNPQAKDAYPIVSFTWLVAPEKLGNPDKEEAFEQVLKWILTSGQKDCAALGYVPLPRRVAERQLSR
jgi:phosphate ABC transporter phosphate-binding protein